jgi:hypothetical protein
MPTPTNTFTGANMEFPNVGIHYLLAELMKFRKQLTVRNEFRSQSGWNNALNTYMMEELNRLGDTLENITYHPTTKTKDELEADAADTTRQLEEDYDATAVSSDNVIMPTAHNRLVHWDLTGQNPDIPQPDPNVFINDHARAFLTGLDRFFTELTRLDSRQQPNTITKFESVMMRALLNELFTICQRKGGEPNRSDIPTGTLPSMEPQTFKGA